MRQTDNRTVATTLKAVHIAEGPPLDPSSIPIPILPSEGISRPCEVRVANGYSATEDPAELWAVTLMKYLVEGSKPRMVYSLPEESNPEPQKQPSETE